MKKLLTAKFKAVLLKGFQFFFGRGGEGRGVLKKDTGS